MNLRSRFHLPSAGDVILTGIGAILCGLGCGFINYASLGMDAIGLFYDGIRSMLDLSPNQIGTASYIVCFILSVFLWFADRKYVNIGSIIYIIMYGAFANIGTVMWEKLTPGGSIYLNALISALGLLILYIGLGIYIAVDIGVDAFTGVMLWLSNITHKDMKYVKIAFDLGLAVIGFLLGGTLGIVTPVSIIIGGPCISFLTRHIQALYFKHLLKNDSFSQRESSTQDKNDQG